jgi:hypothetical protein
MRADHIKDEDSFKAWLNARPVVTRRVEAVALAHRAALRAMVILSHGPAGFPDPNFLLATFRCCINSRLVAINPSRETMESAHSATEAGRTAGFNFNTAMEAAAASASADSGEAIAHAVRAVAVPSQYGSSGYDPDWLQLRDDATRLENGQTVNGLIYSRLWAEEREDRHKQYFRFSGVLDEMNFGFSIWRQWYEAAYAGLPAFGIRDANLREALERDIAFGSRDGSPSEIIWGQEPHSVNEIIRVWVSSAQAKDADTDVAVSVEIPPVAAVGQPHGSVTQFTQGSNGEIIVLADPLSPAAGRDQADLEDLYDEARFKALDVLALGSNMLGSCFEPIQEILRFTPEEFQQARINRIHAKLSTLRGQVHLHEMQMAKPAGERDLSLLLQEEVAIKLSACVQQFNLLMAFDKRGRELNQLAYGPEARTRAEAVIEAMRPIINNIHIVGDSNTTTIVQGDHNAIVNAPRNIHGDQAVERVAQQDENLAMSILQAGWRVAKAVQEQGLAEPTMQFVVAQSGIHGPKVLEVIELCDDAFLWLAQRVDTFNSLWPLILLLVNYAAHLKSTER